MRMEPIQQLVLGRARRPELELREHTCISFAGDIYSWGFYPSVGESVGVDPPFVHSNCDPKLVHEAAWATSGNSFLYGNASGVRVTCGATRWSLEQWQAMGFDKGSSQGGMPSADEVRQQGAALLAA